MIRGLFVISVTLKALRKRMGSDIQVALRRYSEASKEEIMVLTPRI